MNELSLRQTFQYIDADPNIGVREYVPNKDPISLRDDFSIKNPFPIRRIIHLSDFHIGLNDNLDYPSKQPNPVTENQVEQIIQSIIENYKFEDPKPIVVITGDLVDHADCPNGYEHVSKAFNLLEPLIRKKFILLTIPGNHDYSDASNTDNEIACEDALRTDGETLINYFREKADQSGYFHDLVSGISYTTSAYNAFSDAFLQSNLKQDCLSGIQNSEYPSYCYHESWRDKGAVFDLDFLLLDAQDHHPSNSSTVTKGLEGTLTHAKLCLHDNSYNGHDADGTYPNCCRLSHGWLEDLPKPDSNKGVTPSSSDGLGSAEIGVAFAYNWFISLEKGQTLPIVAMHYPISYISYGPPPGSPSGSDLVNESDLFNLIYTREMSSFCHLLMVGHSHYRPCKKVSDPSSYGDIKDYTDPNPKNNFIWRDSKYDPIKNPNPYTTLNYYCEAGATFPSPVDDHWNNPVAKQACCAWAELNINLLTGETIATAINCDKPQMRQILKSATTRYRIIVYNGTIDNAGTDANVYITINSPTGENSGERKLDGTRGESVSGVFENGQVNSFILMMEDVGDIGSIEIRHDNTGKGPGWFLDKIIIINVDTQKEWVFQCNQWLATSEGDGLIDRILYPS